ncbi:hypothetical protein BU26DRAFT_509624 [Trematosphaeria pertusa]|uniref:Uncharacterized protein n=1 Tax=Trematosphaeria pertusa TaxID=390896 RepID=A0A6A6I077_9PLEO|nr:uncharacterized protein BU26DRAFT_509624 [Trematosphaeria pertusa]KAF2243855.1 hypothetical protein BU26DRAFT_509624 [Trematosphaeria pertusa]
MSYKALFTIAAALDHEIHQMDVKIGVPPEQSPVWIEAGFPVDLGFELLVPDIEILVKGQYIAVSGGVPVPRVPACTPSLFQHDPARSYKENYVKKQSGWGSTQDRYPAFFHVTPPNSISVMADAGTCLHSSPQLALSATNSYRTTIYYGQYKGVFLTSAHLSSYATLSSGVTF